MDGAKYVPEILESFDLVACIGASWSYGGHRGTLNALHKMAAPESWIVVGEPYWRHEPEREHLEAIGGNRSDPTPLRGEVGRGSERLRSE
jgi:hypothetical protein